MEPRTFPRIPWIYFGLQRLLLGAHCCVVIVYICYLKEDVSILRMCNHELFRIALDSRAMYGLEKIFTIWLR